MVSLRIQHVGDAEELVSFRDLHKKITVFAGLVNERVVSLHFVEYTALKSAKMLPAVLTQVLTIIRMTMVPSDLALGIDPGSVREYERDIRVLLEVMDRELHRVVVKHVIPVYMPDILARAQLSRRRTIFRYEYIRRVTPELDPRLVRR
jgi:hypothetical protein